MPPRPWSNGQREAVFSPERAIAVFDTPEVAINPVDLARVLRACTGPRDSRAKRWSTPGTPPAAGDPPGPTASSHRRPCPCRAQPAAGRRGPARPDRVVAQAPAATADVARYHPAVVRGEPLAPAAALWAIQVTGLLHSWAREVAAPQLLLRLVVTLG